MPPGTSAGKQVVVLSDGEDLEGGVDEAVAKAKAEGIVVHAVFVGVEGRGAPVPEVDVSGRPTGFKTEEGSPVLSRPDPALLRHLAAETGGSFSVVSPGRTDLDGVAREVDKAARRPLSGSLGTNRRERFQLPLGVAVGALALLLVGPLGFLVAAPEARRGGPPRARPPRGVRAAPRAGRPPRPRGRAGHRSRPRRRRRRRRPRPPP